MKAARNYRRLISQLTAPAWIAALAAPGLWGWIEAGEHMDFLMSLLRYITRPGVAFTVKWGPLVLSAAGILWLFWYATKERSDADFVQARYRIVLALVAFLSLAIGYSAAPSADRALSGHQITGLALALGGDRENVRIFYPRNDQEAKSYANALAPVFVLWKVDGPTEFGLTPDFGSPGLFVRYHEGDPRWPKFFEAACALGVQLRGAPSEDTPKDTFILWVGKNPEERGAKTPG